MTDPQAAVLLNKANRIVTDDGHLLQKFSDQQDRHYWLAYPKLDNFAGAGGEVLRNPDGSMRKFSNALEAYTACLMTIIEEISES